MGKRLRAKNKKRSRDIASAVKKGTAPARSKSSAKRAADYRFRRSNRMK
jgi:hypothetical protein